jgi:hypothetical protein
MPTAFDTPMQAPCGLPGTTGFPGDHSGLAPGPIRISGRRTSSHSVTNTLMALPGSTPRKMTTALHFTPTATGSKKRNAHRGYRHHTRRSNNRSYALHRPTIYYLNLVNQLRLVPSRGPIRTTIPIESLPYVRQRIHLSRNPSERWSQPTWIPSPHLHDRPKSHGRARDHSSTDAQSQPMPTQSSRPSCRGPMNRTHTRHFIPPPFEADLEVSALSY